MSNSPILRVVIILAILLNPRQVMASDIATSVVRGGNQNNNGGYFEFGSSVYSVNQVDVRKNNSKNLKPSLLISGMYQYKGAFLEMIHQSQDGINLGFNIWNSTNWSLDLLAANLKDSLLRPEGADPASLSEADRDSYLMFEDSFYIGAGFRLTRWWNDNYVFQYRIVSDYYNDQGIQSSARLGKSWQVRNWNFHALGSLEFSSARLNQYLFGVSSDEATLRFPEYMPSSSISYGFEVGLAYPISRNLVFRATYRMNVLPTQIYESPFAESRYLSFFSASISYVF